MSFWYFQFSQKTNKKSQLISEQQSRFDVLNFPKKQQNYCKISALASKMGQIKKLKALYYIEWYLITNLHDNVPIIFLICSIFVDYLTFTMVPPLELLWFVF